MTGKLNLVGISCPICSSESTFISSDGEYTRCHRCGVVRTKYDYDHTLYGSDYALNYMQYTKSDVNTPLNLFRLGLVSRWLREGNKILDVGCCVGEFLRFAEPHYSCMGFEPNHKAAVYARQRCSSTITSKLNTDLPSFHCITMFDVLEHIEDPKNFLSVLIAFLEPGGIIALTTPNVDAISKWDHDGLRAWKHYKPQEHLFLHTENSLTSLFESINMEVIHTGTEESDIRPGNPNGDILTFVARRVSC